MPLTDTFIPSQVGGYDPVANGVVPALRRGMDLGMRRPFICEKTGHPSVIINTGRWTVEKGVRRPVRESRRIIELLNAGIIDPVFLTANATAMRKEQWQEVDRVVMAAYRRETNAFADLMARGSPYPGFNAYGRMTLEYEAMSDPGFAFVDMDATTEGRNDSPLFKLRSAPLAITHSDASIPDRKLEVSRQNGDTALDLVQIDSCSARIAESIDKRLIGVSAGIRFGDVSVGPTAHDAAVYTGTGTGVPAGVPGAANRTGVAMASQEYGYLTYPNRLIFDEMHDPSDASWHPELTYNDFLDARQLLYDNLHKGPFMVYHSTDWSRYLDRTFYLNATGGPGTANLTPSRSLRTALKEIEGIQDVKQLNWMIPSLTPLTMIFVALGDPKTVQPVNGMEINVLQWPTKGGLMHNLKVWCIKTFLFRSDFNGLTGLLEATAA